jgi:hypothetical protein
MNKLTVQIIIIYQHYFFINIKIFNKTKTNKKNFEIFILQKN